MEKKLFGGIDYLIRSFNSIKPTEKDAIANFSLIHSLFDFFYNKKVYIKRNSLFSLKKEVTEKFKEIDLEKADKLFILLENYELKEKRKVFTDIEGNDLLRRAKAKYLLSKRFFLSSR